MTIEQQIELTLMKIRPFIQRDGGDISLVKFEDGFVHVKMHGACVGCSLQDQTLRQGVEVILMDEIPGILGVKLID
ncbi:MAG: NifU family protein [Erysipelotrichaceae bacterium]|nr:NifU family protein [Erysipelotrichaceae bacterium]